MVANLLTEARQAVAAAKKKMVKRRKCRKSKDDGADEPSDDGEDDSNDDESVSEPPKKAKQSKRANKKPAAAPEAVRAGAMPTFTGCCMPAAQYKIGVVRFRMKPSRFIICKDGGNEIKKEFPFDLKDEPSKVRAWSAAIKYIDTKLK